MASNVPKKRKRASGECSHSVRPIASANFRLVKHGDSKSIVASKFMSIVPDDLLVEILLRLPNARSVLQYATVCKRWYSLILTLKFSFHRRFIEYHHLLKPSFDSSYLPDHTFAFLFKFSHKKSNPFYYLPSESKFKPKPYGLSFVPNSARLATRASSGDLMLLSEGDRRYYICNSLTKRWFLLPEVPLEGDFAFPFGPFQGAPGFALVPRPSNTDQQLLGRYRVVVLCWTMFLGNIFSCSVAVFDSETRLWTRSYPGVPYPCRRHTNSSHIKPDLETASNGVLYWLDGEYENYHGMASLDPSTAELRLIPLPKGQFRGIRNIRYKHRVRSGVVRGRVRVSRMVESKSKDRFVLRVWELDCGDDTWELVHDVELEPAGALLFFVLAFDPNDGDAVFVVRESEIFRYEISREKFVKVCGFPVGRFSMEMLKKRICRYLKVLPLVHPLWPIPIPALQAKNEI